MGAKSVLAESARRGRNEEQGVVNCDSLHPAGV